MTVKSKIVISKRVIAILLVALLVFSAFNTYLILERPGGTGGAVAYNFVISPSGNNYQLKNMDTGLSTNIPEDASLAINTAFSQGNSIYLNPGTYILNRDILVSNKMNAKIVGDGATIIGNGHKIIVSGDNYTNSEYATISGLTILNGTIRIENSFGTTISNMIFENTLTGIELANTMSWSENTKIEDCHFTNATEGIAFRTPLVGSNATGSYDSSEIDRCFFNLKDNSVGINVEPLAEFSDSQMQDVRMWLGQDGVTNQTGLLIDGTMTQSLLVGVVFESFTDQPNSMYAIDIGQTAKYPPILDAGVSFLGNWTAMIHNPHGIWISGVGAAFERQNESVPVGVNSQYGTNTTIQTLPLKIFTFTPRIQVSSSFANNETITVRIRLQFADNVISNSVTKTFTNNTSIWLTNDDMMQLYPSQDVIWAVVIDAQSGQSSTNAVVTVSGFGTAG
jgi:hypothetical protein